MVEHSLNRNIYSFSHPPLTGNQALKKGVCKKTAIIKNKSVHNQNKSASVNASGFLSAKNSIDTIAFSGKEKVSKEFIDAVTKKKYVGVKAKTWIDKLLEKPKVQKFLQNKKLINFANLASSAPGIMETITSIAVVCTLRPGAILLTPGAEKRDKQYAAAKSWGSALIDLGVTLALLNPIKDAYKLFEKQVEKTGKLKYLSEKASASANRQILNFGPKFVTTPLRAAITIALIPPIMKAIFPKKKAEPEKNTIEMPLYSTSLYTSPIYFGKIDQNIFKKFMNGETK